MKPMFHRPHITETNAYLEIQDRLTGRMSHYIGHEELFLNDLRALVSIILEQEKLIDYLWNIRIEERILSPMPVIHVLKCPHCGNALKP